MTGERAISLTFDGGGERLIARLLDSQAPVTCAAVWKLAGERASIQVRHVIFTGRELGSHIPLDVVGRIPEFAGVPPENQSVFPSPGDLMFQYCPPFQFGGDPEPIYDLSVCYGPDTRLFMPWGWSPANRFASVRFEDRAVLAAVGARMVESRSDTVTVERHSDSDAATYVLVNGDVVLDARTIEPASRHTTIFATFHALAPRASFVLVNDHDPKSLSYHFAAEYAGQYSWEYLDRGPQIYRIRIGRNDV